MISALPQQYKGPIKSHQNWLSPISVTKIDEPAVTWFLSVKRLIFILRKFQTSRQLKTRPSSASILKMADNFFIGRNWPWSNKNLGQGTIPDHQQSEKIKYPGHDESLEPAFLHNDQSQIGNLPSSPSSKKILIPASVKRSSIKSGFDKPSEYTFSGTEQFVEPWTEQKSIGKTESTSSSQENTKIFHCGFLFE